MFRVRTFAAGVLVAAAALLATAAPASAHDQLLSSFPASDQRLDVPPESVTLTFTGELLVLGDGATGAVLMVVDETGRDWASGEVEIEADTVTVPLAPGMPEAGYQVRWQVVSEDGHPIAGVIPFTVGDAEPMPLPDTGAQPPASDSPDQTTPVADPLPRPLLIGAGGAAVAVAVFVLFLFLRRRTAARATSDTDAHEQL